MNTKPMVNDVKLTIRVPNEFRAKLKELSDKQGLKASEIIRRLVLKEIEKEENKNK